MPEEVRVLLVDDEQELAQTLAKRLRRHNMTVGTAHDGNLAYEAMHREKFDVVVLDINMPEVDGIQTMKAIRTSFPEVAVIIHTGAGTINEAQRAIEAGAFDFLFKPVDIKQLTSRIHAAAASRKLVQTTPAATAAQRQFSRQSSL